MHHTNFILILADDMGYGDFGIFGDGSARTPALDQLTTDSVTLTQHYSASPVCAPARATLLTGRYPHRTGAIDTLEGRGLDRLALREVTLANLFKEAGYTTGLVGKWHLGALDPRYHPNARGFDEFIGFRGGWSDYYRWRLDYNGTRRKSDGRYLTDVFTEEAVRFVQRHRREPFFLHVAYNAPHYPLQAPEESVRPFRETGRLNAVLSTLYGMILRMDQGVARILEELDRLSLQDNTVVLFTSDQGPQFSHEGQSLDRFNAHLRGQKGTVFDGGLRVPAILRWPAGLDGGRRVHSMVHFADWLPTLLTMAGLENPSTLALDGQNVLSVLQGGSVIGGKPRFWQWNRYTPLVSSNAAMRDGDWKLVRPPIPEAMQVAPQDLEMDRRLKYEPEGIVDIWRDPEPARTIPTPPAALLFNITEDPSEEHDQARVQPHRAAAMGRQIEDWFASVEAERRSIVD